MKRYKIKVNEIITTNFELNANDIVEASQLVEEIINKTCILKLNFVRNTTEYHYEIKGVKK